MNKATGPPETYAGLHMETDRKGLTMLRFIINYVRSLLCLHDWELVARVVHAKNGQPEKFVFTYRCKRCGYVQRVRVWPTRW